eukprot:gnl/TRDRNA2_/TRDRNA2_83415_c0_seq1.p1 gnl/TRDRNA2_/TRDRNA2_83415_c0~~gnl/TRDRNA2_/TRDRNA2_83415_c0_seq1.p1  ORF type:complete len:455 (-),score=83.43 gnl/TRDRNA2_/TRDRNA2_83415_c0_seq1:158-1522(-)
MEAPFGEHGAARSEGKQDEDAGLESAQPGSPARPMSSSLARESVIVLDWDDTILPTSWLERIHALTAGAQLRPEIQRQMSTLAQACSATMNLCSSMATLIFITNSAPGWVDQSCQLFLPQLLTQVRGYQIFARPMHAPVTFKIGSFRRELRNFKNIVSIGDGDAERAASLRLNAPAGPGGPMSKAMEDPQRRVKSVKLIELPTCQQLLAQHEMLQARLADVVAFQGNLDLKALFQPMTFGSPAAKGGTCTLVHFARPQQSQSTPPSRRLEDAGTVASMGAMTAIKYPNAPGGRALPVGALRQDGSNSQLPPLGPTRSVPHGANGAGSPIKQIVGAGKGSGRCSSPTTDGENTGSPPGGPGAEEHNGRSTVEPEDDRENRLENANAGGTVAGTNGGGRSGPLWKGVADRGSGSRSPPLGQKKRPMISSPIGSPARGGSAAWREQSAPAASKNFAR